MSIDIFNALIGCLFCGVWVIVGQIVVRDRL